MIFVILLAAFVVACIILGGVFLGFIALTAWVAFLVIILGAYLLGAALWCCWWIFDPKAAMDSFNGKPTGQALRLAGETQAEADKRLADRRAAWSEMRARRS